MAIYSFYIFDRHCECIYVRQWHERAPSFRISSPPQIGITSPEVSAADGSKRSSAGAASPASGVGPKDKPVDATTGGPAAANASKKTEGGLSVQDDAKLVFGVVFSLRNMVRKLSGPDDAFISYRTGTYKLHYYETPTNLRFVMLTDVKTNNLRVVLHQIYVNLYVEYVTKNPLSPTEHHGGEGVAVELFEMGLDSFIRTIQD